MQDILEQVVYYLDALWRRRWIALGLASFVALAGWGAVATMPDKYEATSKIYVDTSSVLNPLLEGVAVDGNTDRQLQVMRQTLLARPNLEKVARNTDMDLKARTEEDFEGIVNGLEERITIESTRTNIFTITYLDAKPKRAKEVVQELTTLFVQNNLGQSRRDMETAQDFLASQVKQYETKLDRAESRLANFKQKYRELLPGQSGLQEELGEAQAKLADLRGKLEAAVTRRDILQKELDQTPEMLTQNGGGYGSGPPTQVEARIMEVRARLDQLKSRYTDQHPDVKAAQRRLAALKKELAGAGGPGGAGPSPSAAAEGPGTKVPNPTYSQLRVALVERQSQIQTLRQSLRRQEQTIAEIKRKLQRVPKVEARLQQLKRDQSVIKERYETLLSRRESAKISADRNATSDRVEFRIVEPPRVPSAPAGPPRSIFMAAVLVMSLGAGAGSSALLALTKVTYGSVHHLRRDFDLRVVGLVNQLPGRGARLKRIADLTALGLAILALLAVFGLLVLIERQVGLPTLLEGPMTIQQLHDVIGQSVRAVTSET
jgi:polysaccharide chain length determinant protein (PEP-CTERM system associated)